MSNDISQNAIGNYENSHEINNNNILPADNKISRIGLITSGLAGLTVSTISHVLIVSHLKGVPLRRQILPCLGVAGIGAITGMIANRSVSAVSQNTPKVAENTLNIK